LAEKPGGAVGDFVIRYRVANVGDFFADAIARIGARAAGAPVSVRHRPGF